MISIPLSLFARLETGTNRVRQLEIRESDSIDYTGAESAKTRGNHSTFLVSWTKHTVGKGKFI